MNKLFFNSARALKKNIRKSRELNAERSNMLESTINSGLHCKIPIDSISLENKIILCAYIRACADEALETLLPIGHDQYSIRLSPSKEYSYMLINKLFMEKVIRLDSKANKPSEYHVSTNGNSVVHIDTSSFTINIIDNNGKELPLKSISNILEEKLFAQNKQEEKQIRELWKELALQESLEYLNLVLSERDFLFSPGEKTKGILRQVLTRYSTSQAFYFIYSAAKNASDFYQSRNITKGYAANTIPGKIQTLFDRSVNEGWKISKYKRNYKACPPSALSNVLYDKILGLSPSGIDHIPGTIPPRIVEPADE